MRSRWHLVSCAGILFVAGCRDPITSTTAVKLGISAMSPGASTLAGASIAPAIQVSVLDEDGQIVNRATNTITIQIQDNPGGGTLSGTLSADAVDGVATFNDLHINRSGAGYTLTASSPGLASVTSGAFTIRNGPDAKLVFTTQPVSGIPNVVLPAISIGVQDAQGNTNSTSNLPITLALAPNFEGAVLVGGGTRATNNGAVTFSGMFVTKPGRFTLTATASSLTPANSETFEMIIGPATRLAFGSVVPIARVGDALAPELRVEVRDDGNNTVVTGSHVITLSLASNSFGGTLTGNTTATSDAGVAKFPGLSISAPGSDYRIVASSPTITGSVTSEAIAIRDAILWNTVTAGYFHTCGQAVDGKIFCWGSNSEGQLGTTGNVRTIAAPVITSLNFVSIVAGRSHTCGLAADSAGYCWGANGSGQSGPGHATGNVPLNVASAYKFASVHAGYNHSCGLDNSGKAYCWGDNFSGELGAQAQSGSFVAVSGDLSFASITAGRSFTCGVTKAGAAYCWGENSLGEVGDGTTFDRFGPTPVSGDLTFSYVQAGGFHACGLTKEGKAYCWGQNSFGQLGNGGGANSSVPVAVAGSLTFSSLSVGNRHNCAITVAGQAYCWGDNSTANLGDATAQSRSIPTLVYGGISFISVSAGRFHTCGVAANHSAYCWGQNGGALGDGGTALSYVPLLVR